LLRRKKKLLFYIYAVIVKQKFYKRSTNHYSEACALSCIAQLAGARRRARANSRLLVEQQVLAHRLPILTPTEKAPDCPFAPCGGGDCETIRVQEHAGLGLSEGGRGAQHGAHVLCRVVLVCELEKIAYSTTVAASYIWPAL
jgi:hypothetical protein